MTHRYGDPCATCGEPAYDYNTPKCDNCRRTERRNGTDPLTRLYYPGAARLLSDIREAREAEPVSAPEPIEPGATVTVELTVGRGDSARVHTITGKVYVDSEGTLRVGPENGPSAPLTRDAEGYLPSGVVLVSVTAPGPLDAAYNACHRAYLAACEAQETLNRAPLDAAAHEAALAAWAEYFRLNDAWNAMEREARTVRLEVDGLGCDPGNAFLSVTPRSAVRDPRIAGRFGRTYGPDGKVSGVYLETYASWELDASDTDGREFSSVRVEASSRKAAIGKLLRELGYPRGTVFHVTYEKD